MTSRERVPVCPLSSVPLHHPDIVSGLRELESLLHRCLAGGAAAVTSSGGLLTVTCSSELLLASLPEPPSPPLQLVTTAVRHQVALWRDGGLAVGTLLAGLLARLLRLPQTPPRHLLRERLRQVADVCLRAVEAQRLRLRLEVPQLLAVVGSVLRSKRALSLSAGERRHLGLQLLRAFLQAVPGPAAVVVHGSAGESRGGGSSNAEDGDCRLRMGEVHFQLVPSGDVMASRPVPALLLRQPELDDLPPAAAVPAADRHRPLCLLFAPHMGGTEEALSDADVSLTSELARRPLSADRWLAALARLPLGRVGLVACQRTVDARVRSALAARGPIVLERLGARGAALLTRLSNAQPISAVSLLNEVAAELKRKETMAECGEVQREEGVHLVGRLDGVGHVLLGGRSYAELRRSDAPVITLLVHYPQPEQQRQELQRQLEAALFSLGSLLSEPSVLPGGGCLESVLHHHLVQHAGDGDSLNRAVTEALCSVLRRAAVGVSGQTAVWSDAIYHHLWKTEAQDLSPDDSCVCGLVRVTDLQGNLDFSELAAAYFSSGSAGMSVNLAPADLDPGEISDETIVDNARVKISGLKIALEACYSILGIGTFVFEK